MFVHQAILERRSIRRFKQDQPELALLKKYVDAARLAPSANNLQRLEFVIINEPVLIEMVFSSLRWAGYLKPQWEPSPQEQPTAYIIILANGPLVGSLGIDVGAAAENIALSAMENGVGSCLIGSANKNMIKQDLGIPDTYIVALVVALGYPAEKPIVVEAKDSIEYWRDKNNIHHVPKRRLEEVLHYNGFKSFFLKNKI